MKESPRSLGVYMYHIAQKTEAMRFAVPSVRGVRFGLHLNIDSNQIHVISGNFIPANELKSAPDEMSQRLFFFFL